MDISLVGGGALFNPLYLGCRYMLERIKRSFLEKVRREPARGSKTAF